MKKVVYYPINLYHEYLADIKIQKKDFILSITNYSRKVEIGNVIRIFNKDGIRDNDVLKLINKVRKDAKNWLELDSTVLEEGDYIHFYDLFKAPSSEEIICKIDVKSAYWTYALKKGIITKYTDETLKKDFDGCPISTVKGARLKALGSLATTKIVRKYKDGKFDEDSEEIIIEPTKPLYMEICRGVDKLMRECAEAIPEGVIYYYWDCIFASKEHSQEVYEFMKHKDYDVTINETRLEYVEIGRQGWLFSIEDGKIYGVRKENKHLLNTVDYE